MKIYNIKNKLEYIQEVAILTQEEWGNNNLTKKEYEEKIQKKVQKIKSSLENPSYCKLVLLDENTLIGFISLFPHDGEEELELTPWYATMYVKKEYRGKGYSKILNDAILEEARNRGFKRVYLKTELENYYEKFGAKYIKMLENGEKLYCIEL